MPRGPRLLLPLLALPLVLTGCGGGTAPGADPDALQVVASFYPLEYLAERIAGEHAQVTTLTAPGVDPHEVELTPRQVGSLGSADLVVYAAGMQPAVDDAVSSQAAEHALDVMPSASLLPSDGDDHDHGHGHEHDEDDEAGHDDEAAEATEEHSVDDGHDHGAFDPHFWLDPKRYADVAATLANHLAEVDPEHAEDYRANVRVLTDELRDLDDELAAGLQTCASREVVTTHDAFGYLGARYDLHVVGITGIAPDAEPSPARLAEVTALVEELGVGTVYAEPLLPTAIAETVAAETGAQVLTLDPADGLTADEDTDYPSIMRDNLDALREGLGCS